MKIGGFCREVPKEKGKRTDLTSPHDGERLKTEILEQAGISHYERLEAIDLIPEELFEQHIIDIKAAGKELTTAGMLRAAKGEPDVPQVSHNSGENEWYTPTYG
ncbi:MAG: hypothetical protein GY941_23940 [Planctomycetes bacterium]|nr:hypothetical protein [Planctomycetota bacterium]